MYSLRVRGHNCPAMGNSGHLTEQDKGSGPIKNAVSIRRLLQSVSSHLPLPSQVKHF